MRGDGNGEMHPFQRKGWHTVVIKIPMRRDPTCNVGLNNDPGHRCRG